MTEGPNEMKMYRTIEAPCDDESLAGLTDCYNWPCEEGCEEAMKVEWEAAEQAVAQALTDCYNC